MVSRGRAPAASVRRQNTPPPPACREAPSGPDSTARLLGPSVVLPRIIIVSRATMAPPFGEAASVAVLPAAEEALTVTNELRNGTISSHARRMLSILTWWRRGRLRWLPDCGRSARGTAQQA